MQPAPQKLKTYQLLSLILAIVIIVLSLALLAKGNAGGLLSGSSISPDILSLTQPVRSISATVEQNNGTNLVVSVIPVGSGRQAFFPPSVVQPTTTAQASSEKKLTYTVMLTPDTAINKSTGQFAPPIGIGGSGTAATPKLTAQDIRVGTTVLISSSVDLRTMQSNSFTASSVSIPADVTSLTGKIVSVQGNQITLFGMPASGSPFGGSATSQPKNYTVTLLTNTSIVSVSPAVFSPGKPGQLPIQPSQQKLSISDLKKDMTISVKTDKDVIFETNLTALLVQVFQQSVQPIVAPPSTSSSSSGAKK